MCVALLASSGGCRQADNSSGGNDGCGLEGCILVAPDRDDIDTFGTAISIDGEKFVAGSIVDDPATDAGAAYVFEFVDGDWLFEQKIQAETPVSVGGDRFGGAVAIQGDRIAVGAQGVGWDDPADMDTDIDLAQVGNVFIFEFDGTTWSQVQRLEAPDLDEDDFFGFSVDMDGDWLVIGAYLDDDGGSASGSVYVFEHDGTEYVFDEKLTSQFAGLNDRFGFDVAVDGDVIVVGALQDTFFVGSAEGSATVYEHDGTDWIERHVLLSLDAAVDNNLGISVDIDGDAIIVGAHQADGDAVDSGLAYVHRFGSSTDLFVALEETITPTDGGKEDLFGGSVSIEGNLAIVGAKKDDDKGQRAGSAYIFEYDGAEWVELHKLHAPDATTGDQFGVTTAINAGNVVIGATLAGPGNDASGAVYAFEVEETP